MTRIAASAVLTFIVGVALWPPGNVYWVDIANVLGGPLTLATVAVLASTVGGIAGALLDVCIAEFAAGGLLAYVVGMALVAVVIEPISPVHLLLYAGLLACFVLGAAISAR